MTAKQAIDLLVDPANTVYAINCTPTEGEISVGALYVSPNNPFGLIRLAHSDARFDVELPPELVGSDQFIAVWNITLPLLAVDHV